MKRSLYSTAVLLAMCAAGAVQAFGQESDEATTVTNATGTITQLDYASNGAVQGFLVGTNILLTFPTAICGGISTLGAAGNSVTYSGSADTATSGFETVRVASFTNNTSKATYTAPAATSTTYGPASGAVKLLNYAEGGAIDGFVFVPTGGSASIFVSTGARASATLQSLLTVGATVSVTGTTSARLTACSASGTLEAVDAASLTIGTQTIVIAGGGNGRQGGGGPGH